MFDDVASVTLRSALHGLSMRERAIADNISNVQTPHFLAGKVQFEDALRDAVASGDTSEIAGARGSIARSLEPTREDGNNVNLDQETLAATETGLAYSLMTRAVNDRFNLLRASIGGGV
ncbi:flagellar basal body rod protein FlgB [Motilibacter aurantiacus]|uniref:flagellar basal body rod protein FlgB n=1 Tax=Motilibacter aurantiacus TaxID=2714955 RepID=UPI00140D6B3B|nr:flagellar biosynthesis protein FlgB [Motilibacter aurantiacus]NHC47091.1 flagellar biosynthesis protein FlgB [Motilibacter aurantiacus]